MVTISYENGVFRISDISLITEMLDRYLNQPQKAKDSFPDFLKIKIDPIIFKFIILDLIKERKPIKTFCIQCDIEYYPDQIKVEDEKIICPKGHEILSVIR